MVCLAMEALWSAKGADRYAQCLTGLHGEAAQRHVVLLGLGGTGLRTQPVSESRLLECSPKSKAAIHCLRVKRRTLTEEAPLWIVRSPIGGLGHTATMQYKIRVEAGIAAERLSSRTVVEENHV
mmetsp:Transcript_12479/g.23030  ORF Transcript_12479/g.23030 Transcript_12479/m.23030 type:complete len:124 (-) Transcript_12479:266-637(-)